MSAVEPEVSELPARTDWRRELARIERETGVSLADMKGARRFRRLVAARWKAWALLRDRGWSLTQIGDLFNRDHTTVMYALAKVEDAKRRGK